MLKFCSQKYYSYKLVIYLLSYRKISEFYIYTLNFKNDVHHYHIFLYAVKYLKKNIISRMNHKKYEFI